MFESSFYWKENKCIVCKQEFKNLIKQNYKYHRECNSNIYENKKRIKKEKVDKRKKDFNELQKKLAPNRNKLYLQGRSRLIKRRIVNLVSNEIRRYLKTGIIKPSKKYRINYEAIINHLGQCPGDIKDYHIDHIKPLSLFDFNDDAEIRKAIAPDNRQWLTAEENYKKGNKYPYIKEVI